MTTAVPFPGPPSEPPPARDTAAPGGAPGPGGAVPARGALP